MTWQKIWYPINDRCGWHRYPKRNLWRAFVDGLIDNDEKAASSKNLANWKLDCKSNTLFVTKMAKIDTLFLTKTVEKPHPLGPHIPI